eukprot:CAMPEP_0180832428 /NCGR_PEP_ID=MMETSP1038_2-20121128/76831_1 /TAXON_ID=632150 /ORGANISM="Azadinium spinosum, Strain 3D9" /LENGTH=84 /DNA_ID=CAMNT_0022875621 /DNA_START=68 /DNA_END=322 /DNA_ORIENTATION=-
MVSQAVHLLPEGGPEGEAALQGNQSKTYGDDKYMLPGSMANSFRVPPRDFNDVHVSSSQTSSSSSFSLAFCSGAHTLAVWLPHI